MAYCYHQKGQKDVIRCPKDSIGETQEIGQVRHRRINIGRSNGNLLKRLYDHC